MFKVHEKYNGRETWINADWIWSICQHDTSPDTIIESKHGDVLYVKESVEELRNKIYQEQIRFIAFRRGVVE